MYVEKLIKILLSLMRNKLEYALYAVGVIIELATVLCEHLINTLHYY